MGRYIGPKNKIARRFGVNLGLKTNPAKVSRRLTQMPGVHGPKKHLGGGSSYGKQLTEKQKAKYTYGVRERQFSRYVEEATKMSGNSGTNLQRILELRLDNVIYRLGVADTRAQARQMVTHGMFDVNGKKLDVPSHLLSVGDVVSIREIKAKKKIFETLTEKLSKVAVQGWLSLDSVKKSGKILNLPTEKDFDKNFDVKLIIEYYSSR